MLGGSGAPLTPKRPWSVVEPKVGGRVHLRSMALDCPLSTTASSSPSESRSIVPMAAVLKARLKRFSESPPRNLGSHAGQLGKRSRTHPSTAGHSCEGSALDGIDQLQTRMSALRSDVKKLREAEKAKASAHSLIKDLESQVRTLREEADELKEERDGLLEEAVELKEERDAARAECNVETASGDKLKKQLNTTKKQLENALSGSTCFHASDCCEWQYQINGGWSSFGADAMERVQGAYMELLCDGDKNVVEIASGGMVRKLDFKAMEQEALSTRNRRKIRLKLHVPSLWCKPVYQLVDQRNELYEKNVSADIHDAMLRFMSQSARDGSDSHPSSECPAVCRLEIKTIWRVENFRLWQEYRHRIRRLQESNGMQVLSPISPRLGSMSPKLESELKILSGPEHIFEHVSERWLFHGTSYENAGKIAMGGFDNRLSRRDMYGAGTYFTSQSCKAHQYTCDNHRGGGCKCPVMRTMILARVALGDPYYTRRTLQETARRPPDRENGNGHYDSVIANPGWMQNHKRQHQDHQELVIFDKGQAYPAYVIEYTVA
mmetsp:Transcript_79809/g.258155  ORF Transcript_79809/g.258155 Transcript_79809/m.258155 type:complete len:549 (+) Transcript_79809:106-1752(+)